MSQMTQVRDAEFEAEVLRESRPTLVGFWAQWSGPARAISAAVHEFAGRNRGGVKVLYVNVDEDPLTPAAYGVKTLPTLLLFRGGEVVGRIDGAVPREAVGALFDGDTGS